MKAAVEPCVALIQECNAGSVVSIEACLGAYIVCNYGEQVPYTLSGYNPYDMRLKCDVPPLCYDFGNIDKYLNRYEDKYFKAKDNGYGTYQGLISKKLLELREVGVAAIC